MTTAFPQYAKTSHPEVLAAIERTEALHREFLEKMRDVSVKYTGFEENGVFSGRSMWRGATMVGFAQDRVSVENLPGRWKKPSGIVVEPFATNPIREEFPSFKPEHVPGRGTMFLGEGMMGPGTLFRFKGTAYSRIGFKPDHTGEDHEAFGWVEIMPSEFHLALEGENARRDALAAEAAE